MGTGKRLGGGGLLVLAGTFFGRETVAYVWEGVLNLISAGAADKVTWQTFPWANAAGVVSFAAGVLVLLWPWMRKVFRRATLDEDQVISLIDAKFAEIPAPVATNRIVELESAVIAHREEISFLPGLKETVAQRFKEVDARADLFLAREAYQRGLDKLEGYLCHRETAFVEDEAKAVANQTFVSLGRYNEQAEKRLVETLGMEWPSEEIDVPDPDTSTITDNMLRLRYVGSRKGHLIRSHRTRQVIERLKGALSNIETDIQNEATKALARRENVD